MPEEQVERKCSSKTNTEDHSTTVMREMQAKQHLEIIFINFQASKVEAGWGDPPIMLNAGENVVSQTFFTQGK